MKKIRILHCADLHFDSAFRELDKNISLKSRVEIFESLKKIINLVISEKIEILLIAGDLFDNIFFTKSTTNFIINEFKRIKETYIFISPGNHDPYNKKSVYALFQWPENVYIFKGNMESVKLDSLGVIVWGAAFTDKYSKKTLFENIQVDNNYINLMVLHGEVCTSGKVSEYNPIYLEDIRKSNLNYIALGHKHNFSSVLKEGDTYYSYSGCMPGKGFDETGEKGIIVGDIYENTVDLKFLPMAKRKYLEIELSLDNVKSYEEIETKLCSIINESERNINMYKIILKGFIDEYFNLNEKILYEKMKDKFYYVRFINKTKISINLSEASKNYSLRGKFILAAMEKLRQCNNLNDKEIINLALKIGLQCFSSEEVTLDDN